MQEERAQLRRLEAMAAAQEEAAVREMQTAKVMVCASAVTLQQTVARVYPSPTLMSAVPTARGSGSLLGNGSDGS